MANFSSGLFGALVGGLITMLATYLTLRGQRRIAAADRDLAADERREQRKVLAEQRAAQIADERAATTYAAAVELLQHMTTVFWALPVLYWSSMPSMGNLESDRSKANRVLSETAQDALMKTNLLVLPRLLDPALRRRASAWVMLCSRLMDLNRSEKSEEAEKARCAQVQAYMRYLHGSVDAYLGGYALPPDCDPPSLDDPQAAPWSPPGDPYKVPL